MGFISLKTTSIFLNLFLLASACIMFTCFYKNALRHSL